MLIMILELIIHLIWSIVDAVGAVIAEKGGRNETAQCLQQAQRKGTFPQQAQILQRLSSLDCQCNRRY